MKKIKTYVHLVDFPNSRDIAEELIDLMVNSELIQNAECNFFCHYSKQNFGWLEKKLKPFDKVKIFYPPIEDIDFEMPTIRQLKFDCDVSDEEFHVAYLHHKGVTQIGNPNVKDWRDLMTYFTIEKWKECVQKLDEGYDTVGTNWRTNPYPHYSGNFWWAKSNFIKKLPEMKMPKDTDYKSQFGFQIPWQYGYRHDAEFFIGLRPGKNYSMHDSNGVNGEEIFNHYKLPYPKNRYR